MRTYQETEKIWNSLLSELLIQWSLLWFGAARYMYDFTTNIPVLSAVVTSMFHPIYADHDLFYTSVHEYNSGLMLNELVS